MNKSITKSNQDDESNFELNLDRRIKQLKLEDDERKALEYLRDHAMGYENVKPWRVIEEELRRVGVNKGSGWFSQDVVGRSRKKGYFIGSCKNGYFIIQVEEDAQKASGFYNGKLDAMNCNYSNLRNQIRKEGWGEKIND